jgi:hypothetical protein
MGMMLELSTLQIRKDIIESLSFLWDFRKKTQVSCYYYYLYKPKKITIYLTIATNRWRHLSRDTSRQS